MNGCSAPLNIHWMRHTVCVCVCVCVIWIQTHWQEARRQEVAELQGSLSQLRLAEHHIKLHVTFHLLSVHAVTPHPAADAAAGHLAQHGWHRTRWEQKHTHINIWSFGEKTGVFSKLSRFWFVSYLRMLMSAKICWTLDTRCLIHSADEILLISNI